MQSKPAILTSLFLGVSLLFTMPAQAFDMGNMMNPSKWMGGSKNRDRDRDDDYYDYGPPPGYGWGGPGYGYGGPGYGGYGAPGYGGTPGLGTQQYGTTTQSAPKARETYTGPSYGGNYTGPGDYGPGTVTEDEMEIRRLKERIRNLEQGKGSSGGGRAPGSVW